LDTADLNALAAAHVLAHHQVIFADHIGARLGELSAIAVVGAGRELSLLRSDQPVELVLGGLAAMWTIQRRRLLLFFLVVKVALFHESCQLSS
jgi:hypothetical protein